MRGLWLVLLAFISYQTSPNAIAGQLKLVIATDERDQEVGKDMKVNTTAILSTLWRNVPLTRWEEHQVPPEQFTSTGILAKIDGLEVTPNDTVFFYYGGHGAYDPSRDVRDAVG